MDIANSPYIKKHPIKPMGISLIQISEVLYCLVILLRLITRLEKGIFYSAANLFDYFAIVLYISCVFLLMLTGRKIRKDEKKVIAYFSFIVVLFLIIFGFVFANKIFQTYIEKNVINYAAFFLIVLFSGFYFSRYNSLEKFVHLNFTIFSLVLIFAFVLNFDAFKSLSNLTNLTAAVTRYRNSWGFQHANTAGNICFCYFVLAYFERLFNKRKMSFGRFSHFYYYFKCIIVSYMTLGTLSRNSLLTIALFFLLLALGKIMHKTTASVKAFTVFMVLFTGVVFGSKISSINFTNLLMESNRYWNFAKSVPTLFENHMEVVGFGFMNYSEYLTVGNQYYGTTNLDNFYLYILVSTGILGSCLMTVFLFSVYSLTLKTISGSCLFYPVLIIILLSTFNALFEANLFEPSFMSSLLFFGLYFLLIFSKGQIRRISK